MCVFIKQFYEYDWLTIFIYIFLHIQVSWCFIRLYKTNSWSRASFNILVCFITLLKTLTNKEISDVDILIFHTIRVISFFVLTPFLSLACFCRNVLTPFVYQSTAAHIIRHYALLAMGMLDKRFMTHLK